MIMLSGRPELSTADTDWLLTTTRSARRTLDLEAPVDLAVVRDCLAVALHAANGSNQQSWRWLVVADAGVRSRLAQLYEDVYTELTGGHINTDGLPDDFGRLLESTQWLVEHLRQVPLLVVPCYQAYLPGADSFTTATTWGSIFPAVWNFQLALRTRDYGTCITTMHLRREAEAAEVLGIPDGWIQGCLLPVARLRPGTSFKAAPRRPVDEVAALDRWDGPALPTT